MKYLDWRLALSAAAAATLQACAAPAVPSVAVEPVGSAHFSPTQLVDVLSQAPQQPYVTLAHLRASDPTGVADRSQLVAQLISAAQQLGATALVINPANQAGPRNGVRFDPSGGLQQTSADAVTTTVTGTAIRVEGAQP